MARVNVEEVAFGESRLARFERLMAWDRRMAMGCLVLLWHDSQALMRVDGTEREISDWCWAINADEGKRLVAALEMVGYLTPLDNGRYLIHGNETQIENLMQKVTAASKGGAANKAKWDLIKASRQGIKPATRIGDHPASDSRTDIRTPILADSEREPDASSMQGNAVQCNASNSIPLGPESPRDTASPFDHQLAERWRTEHALRLMPRLRPKIGDWANAVRLLREQDGLTEADIEAVLTFIKADSFWGKNAISPVAVRTRSKNGLKKIENIMLAMKDRPTTVRDSRPVTHLTEEDLANGLY